MDQMAQAGRHVGMEANNVVSTGGQDWPSGTATKQVNSSIQPESSIDPTEEAPATSGIYVSPGA